MLRVMRIQSTELDRQSRNNAPESGFLCADIEDCKKIRIAAILVSGPHREEAAGTDRQCSTWVAAAHQSICDEKHRYRCE
jgi:hypothetical protein